MEQGVAGTVKRRRREFCGGEQSWFSSASALNLFISASLFFFFGGVSRGAIRKQFFKMASAVWQEQQRVKNRVTPSEFGTQKAAHYKLGPWVVTNSGIVCKLACSLPSSLPQSVSPF